MNALKLDIEKKTYTYKDYAEWETTDRYEIIDGSAYMMASPRTGHQKVAGKIYSQLERWLEGKKCTPFISPLDVCLNGLGDNDDTVVQPDVFVVCDPSKITEKNINGVPDFIIEVLSPSSLSYDLLFKLNKYCKAGVREYWVIDPETLTTQVFILDNGEYKLRAYENNGNGAEIAVSVLEGCVIRL